MKPPTFRICLLVLVIYFHHTISLQYKEGEQCDTNSICQNIQKCPINADRIRKGLEQDICDIKQSDLVCCRTTKKYEEPTKTIDKKKLVKRAVRGLKSKKMCEKYAESVFSYETPPILLEGAVKVKIDNCGVKETPLIVGGEAAKPKEFPHMVLIGLSEPDSKAIDIMWQCGGSLVSERWIISAAHCTKTKLGEARWAKLGDIKKVSNEDDYQKEPITLRIVERINHPDYNPGRGYNDVALYKMERDVKFNPYVRPICLNTEEGEYKGKAIATGWGHTNWGGFFSNDLLRVVLNTQRTRECNNRFKNSKKPDILEHIPNGITKQMLCAWERGKDTCQGDSGGPLQIKLVNPYCMYSIIGITSFGDECAKDLPGVYTRVSHYVPWIESIVWP